MRALPSSFRDLGPEGRPSGLFHECQLDVESGAAKEFCKKNGAFNPSTMGTETWLQGSDNAATMRPARVKMGLISACMSAKVPNVGLMAQKAEE